MNTYHIFEQLNSNYTPQTQRFHSWRNYIATLNNEQYQRFAEVLNDIQAGNKRPRPTYTRGQIETFNTLVNDINVVNKLVDSVTRGGTGNIANASIDGRNVLGILVQSGIPADKAMSILQLIRDALAIRPPESLEEVFSTHIPRITDTLNGIEKIIESLPNYKKIYKNIQSEITNILMKSGMDSKWAKWFSQRFITALDGWHLTDMRIGWMTKTAYGIWRFANEYTPAQQQAILDRLTAMLNVEANTFR